MFYFLKLRHSFWQAKQKLVHSEWTLVLIKLQKDSKMIDVQITKKLTVLHLGYNRDHFHMAYFLLHSTFQISMNVMRELTNVTRLHQHVEISVVLTNVTVSLVWNTEMVISNNTPVLVRCSLICSFIHSFRTGY